MLDTTNPEVLEITRQIDNCYDLQRIIQRKIDENHPIEYVKSYVRGCGTAGCVLGDFVLEKHGYETLTKFYEHVDQYNSRVGEVFSFNNDDWLMVFGTSKAVSYSSRLSYVDNHISALEQKRATMLEGV